MKLTLLNESLEDSNKGLKNLYEFLKTILKNSFNIKSWITTLTDTMSGFIGNPETNAPAVFAFAKEDAEYSNILTNMFENTKITVFEYDSKNPNAYTYVGNPPLYRKLSTTKIYGLLQAILPFSLFFNIIGNIVQLTAILSKQIEYTSNNKKIIYNPSTKKFSYPVSDITIFIASSLKDVLDNNQDEIVAILLHEVGHNIQMLDTLLNGLINTLTTTFVGSYSFMSLIQWAYNYLLTNKNLTGNRIGYNTGVDEEMQLIHQNMSSILLETKMNTFYFLIAKLVLLCFICSVVNSIMRRKMEIKADEMAIKLGYGESLYKAITKLHNSILFFRDHGESTIKIKGINIFDFIGHIYSLFLIWLIQLSGILKVLGYPDPFTREKLIKEKTKAYDISDKNIDRTDNIKLDNTIKNQYLNF